MSDIKYEPTREHWKPYEPWMRDVLASDARVSWVIGANEYRSTWDRCIDFGGSVEAIDYIDRCLTERNTRIHPDDVTGEQVTDKFGKVRHFRDGKWRVWSGGSWAEMKGNLEDFRHTWGPFRPTTDADRKRVGLYVDTAPDDNHTSDGRCKYPKTCESEGTHKPTPDDLPGEPVEPGDLRAGDRVAFTWGSAGERIICALVSDHGSYILRSDTPDSVGYYPNVVYRSEWDSGISDVRLIERAPREDVDPDEALAKVLHDADSNGHFSWEGTGLETRADYLRMARAAREHIEAEREEGGYNIRRAERERKRRVKAETERDEARDTLDILVKRQTDDQSKIERLTRERDDVLAEGLPVLAEKVERLIRERDVAEARCERLSVLAVKWQARYAALRGAVITDPSILRLAAADIEAKGTGFGGLPRSLPATLRGLADALTRDDERGQA